jgi:hypothetical protein
VYQADPLSSVHRADLLSSVHRADLLSSVHRADLLSSVHRADLSFPVHRADLFHHFIADESGLEDSWVAALDKRPFSKNGKRMGRPSRQVKEAILQFRLEKQAAAVFREDAGPEGGSAGTESTEELGRALADASAARDGPLPKFTKSGKRIGRPPRAMRKPESKPAVLPEPAPPVSFVTAV